MPLPLSLPGDVMEAEIERIGVLRNRVVPAGGVRGWRRHGSGGSRVWEEGDMSWPDDEKLDRVR
jgi:hypothetical protein